MVDHKTPFVTFMRHGTAKYMPSSVRRPGNRSGNHRPSCTPDQAKKFMTINRPQWRGQAFKNALEYVNDIAGGESRKVRRLMARARSKR